MIESGVWNPNKIAGATSAIDALETFLTQDTKLSNGKIFNTISDLAKYLKSLTDDCTCQATNALCSKATAIGSGPVGCTGDPCKDNRILIDKILEKLQEKMGYLTNSDQARLGYKEQISAINQSFQDDQDPLRCIYRNCISSSRSYRIPVEGCGWLVLLPRLRFERRI